MQKNKRFLITIWRTITAKVYKQVITLNVFFFFFWSNKNKGKELIKKKNKMIGPQETQKGPFPFF